MQTIDYRKISQHYRNTDRTIYHRQNNSPQAKQYNTRKTIQHRQNNTTQTNQFKNTGNRNINT